MSEWQRTRKAAAPPVNWPFRIAPMKRMLAAAKRGWRMRHKPQFSGITPIRGEKAA